MSTLETKKATKTVVKSGITFGTCLAMVISYTTWHSVGWAIFLVCSAGCMSSILSCDTDLDRYISRGTKRLWPLIFPIQNLTRRS